MDFISYVILGLSVLTSGFLYYAANSTDYSRAQARARLVSQWRLAGVQTRQRLNDEKLANMLRQAGFKMSPATYYYLRLVLVFMVAIPTLRAALQQNVFMLVMPIFVWVVTTHAPKWPMWWLFLFLARQHSLSVNKDLYTLYALVKQQLMSHQEKPRQIYDILTRVTPRLPRLNYALTKCLTLWNRDPRYALMQFAETVGTEQAKELSKILQEVQESSPEVAIEILKQRKDDFQSDRLANFRQRIWLRGLVGFAVAFLGFTGAAWDFATIIQMYTDSLMTF